MLKRNSFLWVSDGFLLLLLSLLVAQTAYSETILPTILHAFKNSVFQQTTESVKTSKYPC